MMSLNCTLHDYSDSVLSGKAIKTPSCGSDNRWPFSWIVSDEVVAFVFHDVVANHPRIRIRTNEVGFDGDGLDAVRLVVKPF